MSLGVRHLGIHPLGVPVEQGQQHTQNDNDGENGNPDHSNSLAPN
jgi:hypothetical protein